MSRGPAEFSGGFETNGRFNASCPSSCRVERISGGPTESRTVNDPVRLRRRLAQEPADPVSGQDLWCLGTHRQVQTEIVGRFGDFAWITAHSDVMSCVTALTAMTWISPPS